MPYLGNRNKTRILIVNDGRDCGASYTPLFRQLGEVTDDPSKLKLHPYNFKLIVFTGGADVTPTLYGDISPKGVCRPNLERDREEVNIYKFAQQRGIKMVGICRGMQFLNVMTGGKMMHDITGHSNGDHRVMVRSRDEPFITNSFHHQMCIPHKDTHILAWSHTKLSKHYIGDKDEAVDYKGPEVEAIYMPWLKAVGVQWHPEAAPKSGLFSFGATWYRFLVEDLLGKSSQQFKKAYLGEISNLHIVEAR